MLDSRWQVTIQKTCAQRFITSSALLFLRQKTSLAPLATLFETTFNTAAYNLTLKSETDEAGRIRSGLLFTS
jgi:hypothetical protein